MAFARASSLRDSTAYPSNRHSMLQRLARIAASRAAPLLAVKPNRPCQKPMLSRALAGFDQVFPWADLQICSRQIRKRPQDREEQRGGFRFNERSPGVLSGYPWKRHSMLRRLPRMAASWTADFLAKAKQSLPVTYAARAVVISHRPSCFANRPRQSTARADVVSHRPSCFANRPCETTALSASALRNPYAPARTHRRILAAPFLAEAKSALPKSLCSQERSLAGPAGGMGKRWNTAKCLKNVRRRCGSHHYRPFIGDNICLATRLVAWTIIDPASSTQATVSSDSSSLFAQHWLIASAPASLV